MPIAQALFAKISSLGSDPQDSDETRLHKRVMSLTLVNSLFSLLLWTVIYFASNEPLVGSIYLAYTATNAICLGLWVRHRAFRAIILIQLSLILLIPVILTLILGGLEHSAGQIFWGILGPIGALVYYSPRRAVYLFIGYLIMVIVCAVLQPVLRPTNNLSPLVSLILFTATVVIVTGFAFGNLYFFLAQRNQAMRLLREQQEKSENLLLNILPSEIAAILKNENRPIADHFNEASILFADMVNFTPLSATMPPLEMVDLLNEVFTHLTNWWSSMDWRRSRRLAIVIWWRRACRATPLVTRRRLPAWHLRCKTI
jgi:adenylate cyclase